MRPRKGREYLGFSDATTSNHLRGRAYIHSSDMPSRAQRLNRLQVKNRNPKLMKNVSKLSDAKHSSSIVHSNTISIIKPGNEIKKDINPGKYKSKAVHRDLDANTIQYNSNPPLIMENMPITIGLTIQ